MSTKSQTKSAVRKARQSNPDAAPKLSPAQIKAAAGKASLAPPQVGNVVPLTPKGPAKSDNGKAARKAAETAAKAQRERLLGELESFAGKVSGAMLQAVTLTADTGFMFTQEEIRACWPSCDHPGVYCSQFNAGAAAAKIIGRDAALALIGEAGSVKACQRALASVTKTAKGAGCKVATVEQRELLVKGAKEAAAKVPEKKAKADKGATPASVPKAQGLPELIAALTVLHSTAGKLEVPAGRKGAHKDGMAHLSKAIEAFTIASK